MALDQRHQDLGPPHVDIKRGAGRNHLLVAGDHGKGALLVMGHVKACLAFQQMQRAFVFSVTHRHFAVGIERQLRTVGQGDHPALACGGVIVVRQV